ncbi:DNA topoisomerase I [Oleidesulfovibrio alaskensis G20]|jgi:DNA topoisomerase-1|uniref:DNA topoisomerase 1 n=1 Tax=Oleidesulfovibrio alaskensis (strain ATCC BAA-1058 / DSM 17464 / G20) TaxID=207559 RepID=Q317I9_OLEA2|nr:type I DNA topoisomerase [Oleidesulfovibrio alaskensis]ABB36907.1 DNA topoisomerase I [Oleidesulfovibrio alaskensis G20]MBG0774177.1 type I DNA topoisomerase [Oleidesulfovibrio alaskensis]
MGKDLIIVESPAKVKTIKKFLGNKYMVQASVGHIRDLPTKELGVDEENDFSPDYQVIQGKQKVVSALREAAAKADNVFLAPDPDREGEAIAWHVAEIIAKENKNISRIQFNEITARAVREALENPRELNRSLFDAQQARRVLDRLVGYKISPILWNKIKRGISAGRVQSVALRLIVDRERERYAFTSEEYWVFRANLAAETPPPFKAELFKVDDKKPAIASAEQAQELEKSIEGKAFIVDSVQEKERSRKPQPPFITSTLQQLASQRLGFSAKRTMSVAQRLYEGLDLGDMGTTALITYMRTDSVRISDEARDSARELIASLYGKEYCPAKAPVYKTKGSAQDAHEAIRPVDVTLTPDKIKGLVAPEQYSLYRLIWSRFMASQMAPARFHDTTVLIGCGGTQWRVKGERLLFPGYMAAAPASAKEANVELPPMQQGQTLELTLLEKEQKFTQPPARYSEASLVREMEEKGIGRPSTYASIISTIVDRDYTRLEEKHFVPTDLGFVVCDMLTNHFGTLMDIGFTAQMENSLDKVAEGDLDWVALMKDFTSDFNPTLASAAKEMKTVKAGLETDIVCSECGKPMAIKFGKAGPFLACTGYPDCKNTSNFTRDESGTIQLVEREQEELKPVGTCPECGKDLVVKQARTGSRFIACTGYPDCKHTEPFSTGVPCPNDGCDGQLVEKSSRRGKIFYSCNRYPQCDYATWNWPVAEACPQCDSKILTIKSTKARGKHIACPACKYTRALEDEE